MNKPSQSSHRQSYHELVNEYEKFRADALDKSKISSNRQSGCSILLFRGMATWIETCRYSQITQINHRASNDYSKQSGELISSETILKEATIILTNIVLSHQKLPRTNYA
jgi:hypothetical protein